MIMFSLSGNVLLLMFLYFIQGLPYGLQAQFLPVYLRSRGVNLTDIGLLKVLYAPWLCKFIWGPLVDQYGTKRKWLLISILCLAITCIFSALFPPEVLIPIVMILFFLNLFASIQDVAVDAVAIRLLTFEELGQGNTVQVVGYKLGSIFGGGILASFVNVIGWFGLFLILAILYVEAGMFIYVSPSLRGLETNLQKNDKQSKTKTLDEEYFNPEVIQKDGSTRHRVKEEEVETIVSDEISEDNEIESADYKKMTNESQVRDDLNPTFSSSQYFEVKSTINTDDRDHLQLNSTPVRKSLNKMSSTFISTFRRVAKVPGTKWMIAFLLLFKLGEQGALNMLPLFFLDQKVHPTDVSFWTGIIGQGASIGGSIMGGWLITTFRKIPLEFLLQQLCLLRLLPIGAELLLVVLWDAGNLFREVLFYLAIGSMLLLLFVGGIITTLTFTFMMQYSRSADSDIQATHYTTLATVEVLGKLVFTAACGWMAEFFGYRFLFLTFAVLSVTILPLMKACPRDVNGGKDTAADEEENVQMELNKTKEKNE